MKGIHFLSKSALICNLCFLLFVFFNLMEFIAPDGIISSIIAKTPILRELIIILGFSAIVINSLVCITYLILLATGKMKWIPRKIGIINVLFLIAEGLYFFL